VDDALREIRLVAAGSMAVARPLPVKYKSYANAFCSQSAEKEMHPSGWVSLWKKRQTEEDRDCWRAWSHRKNFLVLCV
jgi:hypothetical protein